MEVQTAVTDRDDGLHLDRHDLGDHRLRRGTGVRNLTGKRLDKHGFECMEIGASVDMPVVAGPLGTYVLRNPDAHTGLCFASATCAAHRERDAEVHHDRLPVLQHDVVWREIAVYHIPRMRTDQRTSDADRVARHILEEQQLLVPQWFSKALPIERGTAQYRSPFARPRSTSASKFTCSNIAVASISDKNRSTPSMAPEL